MLFMSYADAHRTGTLVNGGRVYRIPEQFLPDLQKKIARINKRAEKLGKDLVTLTDTGETQTVEVQTGGRIGRMTGGRLTYRARYMILKGSTPVLDGWRFLAVILHKRTGNEFVQVPNWALDNDDLMTLDLAKFVYKDRDCDHCHKLRVRNATYLVRHDVTGEIKQVGSTCLGDFTGFDSPQAACSAWENIFKLFQQVESYSRMVPRTAKSFPLNEWLAFVAQQIDSDGWRSRQNYGTDSTADRAKVAIINYTNDPNSVEMPTEAHMAHAERVIEWARNVDVTGNDFLRDMQACMVDEIVEQDMGRTAAAFPAMWRAEREAQDKVQAESSEWYGATGQTYNMALEVIHKGNPYENNFGGITTNIYMRNAEGTNFLWYCSAARNNMVKGEIYSVRGTVKKHDVSRKDGSKVTVLTRCRVIESTPDITALVS